MLKKNVYTAQIGRNLHKIAEKDVRIDVHILSMANTRFYLDERRTKKGNPSVLKVAIAHKGSSAFISMDVKLLPNQWDDEMQRIINHPERTVLNTYIQEIKLKVDSLIISLMRESNINTMTASQIKALCMDELDPDRKKAKEDKTTFLHRFMKYAERMKPGSRKTFDHTLNRLTAFIGEAALKRLKFEDMTVDWLTSLDIFMAKTAPSKNSRNIHFRNIRTVFNDAIEDNITSFYPFRRFKIKNEVTAKRDLSAEELRRLVYFDCEECAVKYRDYFMLMFYLMGINNIDLCHVKEITKGRLEFHRTKTRHFFSMKIEPEAMALIEKYRGENWLLDILDHWSSDVFFRKKMNKHLQKIGPVTRSGLGGKKTYSPMFPKLTTYYARHSWASIAFSLDIPIETISEGLGHEYGNPITRIYIHNDTKKIDAANRKVIDWVLYGKIDGKTVVKPGTPEFFGLDRKEAVALGLVKDETEKKKRGRPRKDTTQGKVADAAA